MKTVSRVQYLEKIKEYLGSPLIKVLTGMRRVGKTYIMREVIAFLKSSGISENQILYINKEDITYDNITDYKGLAEYIDIYFGDKKFQKYIFIDEIQDIVEWEKAIRSYLSKGDYEIFITGSNSKLLSSDLATYLTGRYVEVHIYPLNFQEFLEFRKKSSPDTIGGTKEEFQNYLRLGGLPAIHNMQFSQEMIYSYAHSVLSDILYRDIVSRYSIRNPKLLNDIFKFLSDNIGNLFSTKKILDYLKNEKISLSFETLREYVQYFQNTFLMYKSERYDIKGKKLLTVQEKYYIGDVGIRNSVLGYRIESIGQLLENIVYLELLFRGYQVRIGSVEGDKEIDFIAEKDGKKEYYQVTYLLSSESTIKREFGSYDSVADNYPKFVLSMDDILSGPSENGIIHKNIIEWLVGA